MTQYQPMPFVTSDRAVEIIYNQYKAGQCISCEHKSTTLYQYQWNQFLCPPCFQFMLDCNFPKPIPQPKVIPIEEPKRSFVFNPWNQIVGMAA